MCTPLSTVHHSLRPYLALLFYKRFPSSAWIHPLAVITLQLAVVTFICPQTVLLVQRLVLHQESMRVAARDLTTLDAQYLNDLFIVRALSIAGYVILVYDFIDSIPDEVRYIWPTLWSTVKVIYLANRYGNLVFLAAVNAELMGMWRSDAHSFCFQTALACSLIGFASFASLHVLVLLRAWATWSRHTTMLAVLVTVFMIYAVVSMAIIAWAIMYIGDDAYPLAPIVGTCIIAIIPPSAWVLWIPSILLECITFVLTMWSIRQFSYRPQLARRSPLMLIIFRDGIIWFVVALFSNIFNMLVWAYYGDRPLNLLANTFTLSLMTTTGQRLVLDLRKVSTDDSLSTTRVGREVERAIEGLPPSRSPSPMVFARRASAPPTASALSWGDWLVLWNDSDVGGSGASGNGDHVEEPIELTRLGGGEER